MNHPGANESAGNRWASGWELDPPDAARGGTLSPRLRTMNRPGSVGPDAQPPGWSFHLEWPEERGPVTSELYACGYRLRFARAPESACEVFLAEPGLLCGHLGHRVAPALFCAETDIRTAGPMTWIETKSQHVVLVQEAKDDGIRFCLAVESRAGHAEAAERARRGLERKFEEAFQAEISRRPAWRASTEPRLLDPAVEHLAVETLFARLRPPQGLLPFRWTEQDPSGPARFSLRHLYPLVLAWAPIDSAVALDLVKCALSCQQPDGRIPSEASPDYAGEQSPAALPLIAQAAREAWIARHDPGFPDFAAPRLRRYLRWACRHYDPEQTGLPCWPSAEEALIPEAHDAGLASPELAAFLLCEIEAYLQLARACVTTAGDEATWQAEIQRLKDALHHILWDERRSAFTSRYVRGAAIERRTLSSLLPLTATGLRADQRQAILQALRDPAAFRGPAGAPAWVRWESDEEPPPAQALHQILLLDTLRRGGAPDEARALAQTLCRALAARHADSGGLPDRLDAPAPAPGIVSLAAATLALTVDAPAAAEAPVPASPALAWMERHRSSLLAGVVGLLVLGLMIVAITFLSKTAPPRGTLSAWTGLATRYHQEGRYDEAQELYEKILASGRNLPLVELLLANTLLRKGDLEEAEARYRKLVAAPDPHPVACLNLAVTLYLRGQTNEAFLTFREFADRYGEQQPQLAFRARTAMQLLAPEADATANTGLPAVPRD